MTQRTGGFLVAGVCGVIAIALVAASLLLPLEQAGAEDRNGDGRPDIWRVYDQQRRLLDVSIDTNFDGRSDVHEHYDRGVLVRRESDRDFSDRIDLVEEFDTVTHQRVRSVTDVDYNGTADLLELFQGGQIVYSKWASPERTLAGPRTVSAPSAPPLPTRGQDLAPFADPFASDLVVRSRPTVVSSREWVGLSTSGGLPASSSRGTRALTRSTAFQIRSDTFPLSAVVGSCSPRGPPAVRILA